jgi:hypothetical protein
VDVSPRRPRPVRAARALLVVIVVLGLAEAGVGLVARRQFDPAAIEFRTASLILRDRVLAELSSSLWYAVLSGLTVIVVLVPLAIALRRPRAWARTVTWMVLVGHVVVQALFLSANPTLYAEPDTSALERNRLLWDRLLPDWYAPATHLIEVPLIFASIAVIVLLALDASREYFAYRFQVATDDPRIWTLPRRTEVDGLRRPPRSADSGTP